MVTPINLEPHLVSLALTAMCTIRFDLNNSQISFHCSPVKNVNSPRQGTLRKL